MIEDIFGPLIQMRKLAKFMIMARIKVHSRRLSWELKKDTSSFKNDDI